MTPRQRRALEIAVAIALTLLALAFARSVRAEPVRLAQAPASERVYRAGSLLVTAPWSRATPAGAPVAAGYLTISNPGGAADRLIGATLAAAGRVEVHEMTLDGGVMRMREVKGGILIPANGGVELRPGEYHLMFMDLKAPFAEGAILRGTLVFERAGPLEVEFRVGGLGARKAPD